MSTAINFETLRLEAFKKWDLQNGNDSAEATIDGETVYAGASEYLVLTDNEATERTREYIKESVWAFNKSFLDTHSEAISEMDEKAFSAIQRLCESANKAIWAMIDDKEHFIDDAISADGRGHFLSSYDGEENEVELNGEYFYIYQIN